MSTKKARQLKLDQLQDLIKQKEEDYLREVKEFNKSSSLPLLSSLRSMKVASHQDTMSNSPPFEGEGPFLPEEKKAGEVESGGNGNGNGKKSRTNKHHHKTKSSADRAKTDSESEERAAADFILKLQINPGVPLDPIYPRESMNGAANGSPAPLHAGQQMDLNFLYSKVLELSDQLRENREQTQRIIAGAEEIAKRYAAVTTGQADEVTEESSQLMTARVAELTHKLADAEELNKVLLHEQRENGKLIGEYEQGMEKVVGMLRDFAHNKEMEKNNLAREYLKTLQAERDEHLKTRLDRDQANAHVLKLIGQMRHAYKLAVDESLPELEIVAGLQYEVRSLRSLAGLPKQDFEDETGYSILRDVKGGAGEEED